MKLQFESLIDAPRPIVFAFFEDPCNLGLIHSADPGFRVICHDGKIEIGCRTWFEVNMAGVLPVAFGFRHTVYDPPNHFAEEQFHGPFSRFVHVHEFEIDSRGTLVRDCLDIELPLYYGGELAMAVAVAPAVRLTFAARAKTVDRLVREGAFEPSRSA